jgi:tetratricopeptide (TPR) repeat protein
MSFSTVYANSGNGLLSGVEKPDNKGTADFSGRIASNLALLKKDPKNLDLLQQLGNDYYDLNDYTNAILSYSKYIRLKPDNPNVLTDRGVMFYFSGNSNPHHQHPVRLWWWPVREGIPLLLQWWTVSRLLSG